jgi:hypothetical protein
MDFYPKAAMQRAMKVPDVMLQAMAKKITWCQAAEILRISDRRGNRLIMAAVIAAASLKIGNVATAEMVYTSCRP